MITAKIKDQSVQFNNNRWTSIDNTLAALLNLETTIRFSRGIPGYDPDPEQTIAKDILRRFNGENITISPRPPYDPQMVY